MTKLLEGKEYNFLVEKELTLPDRTNHYLLKGPDEKKYLLPVDRYPYYGIVSGKPVKCRVDRINCKGEVFLEPKNPWYSEGKSYEFIVSGTEARTDSSGINHRVTVVIDKAGNKIAVPHKSGKDLPAEGTKIRLKVERISKGKLQLVITSRAISARSLIPGQTYEFVIERIEKGMDDEEYFIIKDPFGKFHTISRRFYEYYGYSPGTKFRGKVIKYNTNGEKTIEPENPYFKPGSVIKMKVIRTAKNIINPLFTLNLVDKFGFTHCLETESLPHETNIKCRIVMIKKGKPVLELL